MLRGKRKPVLKVNPFRKSVFGKRDFLVKVFTEGETVVCKSAS
jgi:hypothetical protein